MPKKTHATFPRMPRILTLRFRKKKPLKDFKSKSLGNEVGSLPNLITISRIVLIPVILYFLQLGTVEGHYFAALFFLFAGISDGLDGYLARKFNQSTLFGKFLDPLADKVTTLSIMVYLTTMSLVPPWLVILMLFRELSITGLRTIAVGEGVVISASNSGKIKTAFQFVGLTFLLTNFSYSFLGTDFVINYHKMGLYILYLSLIMSLFSAFEYFALFMEAVENKNRRKVKMLEEAAIKAGLPKECASNPSLTVFEEHELEVEMEPESDTDSVSLGEIDKLNNSESDLEE